MMNKQKVILEQFKEVDLELAQLRLSRDGEAPNLDPVVASYASGLADMMLAIVSQRDKHGAEYARCQIVEGIQRLWGQSINRWIVARPRTAVHLAFVDRWVQQPMSSRYMH
jgi:hypothetical protein